jgi:hypothetical protein
MRPRFEKGIAKTGQSGYNTMDFIELGKDVLYAGRNGRIQKFYSHLYPAGHR